MCVQIHDLVGCFEMKAVQMYLEVSHSEHSGISCWVDMHRIRLHRSNTLLYGNVSLNSVGHEQTCTAFELPGPDPRFSHAQWAVDISCSAAAEQISGAISSDSAGCSFKFKWLLHSIPYYTHQKEKCRWSTHWAGLTAQIIFLCSMCKILSAGEAGRVICGYHKVHPSGAGAVNVLPSRCYWAPTLLRPS